MIPTLIIVVQLKYNINNNPRTRKMLPKSRPILRVHSFPTASHAEIFVNVPRIEENRRKRATLEINTTRVNNLTVFVS